VFDQKMISPPLVAKVFAPLLEIKPFAFKTSVKIPMPFTSSIIPSLPFSIFAKTYTDIGYCYNKKNYAANLNNRFLYTGGFGIDILTLYDISLKIEYSFNQLGQGSLYFENR
jgi:hypothetical protein